MPLYEFKCTKKKCKPKFEKVCPIGTETVKCPECGEQAIKVASVPAPAS